MNKKKVDDDWKKEFIQTHCKTCDSMLLSVLVRFLAFFQHMSLFHNEENTQKKGHKTDSTHIPFRMYAVLQLMEKQERNVRDNTSMCERVENNRY